MFICVIHVTALVGRHRMGSAALLPGTLLSTIDTSNERKAEQENQRSTTNFDKGQNSASAKTSVITKNPRSPQQQQITNQSQTNSKSFDYYVEGLISRTIWALGEKIFPLIGKRERSV